MKADKSKQNISLITPADSAKIVKCDAVKKQKQEAKLINEYYSITKGLKENVFEKYYNLKILDSLLRSKSLFSRVPKKKSLIAL